MEKYELQKNCEINIARNFCHFVMKNQYCQKYCHFQNFLPKICHKSDKHSPYFLSSIWQPWRTDCRNNQWRNIERVAYAEIFLGAFHSVA